MNTIHLNIELFQGRTDLPLNALDTQAAVHAAFPSVPAFGIRAKIAPNKQGRATLVCYFDLPEGVDVEAACWALCDATQQEAVAIMVGDVGYLYGPKAESWGAFDASEFIL